MAQVIDTKRYKYDRLKLRDPNGVAHYSATKLDAVARSLVGMNAAGMVAVLQENGLDYVVRHSEKKIGHFRMIVGQSLRAILNKGSPVMVRGLMIKTLDQDVPLPEGWRVEPVVRQGTPTPYAVVTFKKDSQ